MAKMIISENRLHELIQESIYEVLQEAQYDESIGSLLGDGVRNAKKLPSKIKNAKIIVSFFLFYYRISLL